MPSITNVGGSLTSAIALTLLAWAVRFFRKAAQQRKHGIRAPADAKQPQKLGRYFCSLSPAALRMLVMTLHLIRPLSLELLANAETVVITV